MDATFRQLTAYVAVARAASFTAAAAQLHVSQSSLSRAVADLERHLGVRLLERHTRNVELTAAGAETLRVAECIVTAHRAGMNELRRYLGGEAGGVSIATLPSVAAVLLPEVVSTFCATWPQVSIHIRDGLERTVLDCVRTGEVDFALATVGEPTAGLDHQPLVRDRFVAVLPATHRLADRTEVSWAELARERFLAVGHDSSVRRLTDTAFAQVDMHAAPAAEAGNVSTVGGLVAAGLGVSAMPALVLPLMGSGPIVCRPLVDPVLDRTLEVATRAQRTVVPAAQRFLDALTEYAGQGKPLPDGVSWAE